MQFTLKLRQQGPTPGALSGHEDAFLELLNAPTNSNPLREREHARERTQRP